MITWLLVVISAADGAHVMDVPFASGEACAVALEAVSRAIDDNQSVGLDLALCIEDEVTR